MYSTLINDLLRGNASVTTYHSPLLKQQASNNAASTCPVNDRDVGILKGIFNTTFDFAFIIADTYFIVFPRLEKITVFKHLQLMTGLLPAAYWLANLFFDMLIYIVSCALLIIITASMDLNVFTESEVMRAFILILLLYGLSGIINAYIFSLFGRSPLSGAGLLYVWGLCYGIIKLSSYFEPGNNIFERIFVAIVPFYALRFSMVKLLEWAIMKRNCKYCPFKGGQEGCLYVKQNPLLNELMPAIIALSVQAIVWFVLLLLFDHGLGRKLKGALEGCCCGEFRTVDDADQEVALERQRVQEWMLKGEGEQPELISNGLRKNYCQQTAVYDVTFGAERGECFGLVGVNGSGKTTTFAMLAALICPTKGTAVIEGTWKLTDCEYTYMKRVGYCPQHDGLLKELSGRSTLKLFGRLSGVPGSHIDSLVDQWINALDMAEIANRPCGQYSGGNKRKLSLAIALIGNHPVVLLDEPTAGVDPVVRRRIWQILTNSLEQYQQTIILTSHTMSECEAICDRLTIMVKGVMKCLGPIPILKHAYGKRCILEVKFSSNSTIEDQNVVKSKIETEFRNRISLEERQLTRLKFILNTENAKMYDMFSFMLKIQSKYEIMEDFKLVEAPLEEVFLQFAQNKTM